MKLHSTLLLIFSSLSSVAISAAGYSGLGDQAATTVYEALSAPDDAPVVLQGTITKRVTDDIYEFQDSTGVIEVDIDNEDWPVATINHLTKVKLTGEVDRGLIGREIDVKFVEVVAR